MATRTTTLSVLALSSSSSSTTTSSSSSSQCSSLSLIPRNLKLNRLSTSFLGHTLSISSSSSSSNKAKHRRSFSLSAAAVSAVLSLPTAKPDRVLDDKNIKWSERAIKAFGISEVQSKGFRYYNTGTECLLVAILLDGTSIASMFLRANGITLFKVREETVKLLGGPDREHIPVRPPLSESAQRALDWAVDEKLKSGEPGEITTSHLLLGIWSEKESEGHKILATFGFDDEKAKKLAKVANEDGCSYDR